MADPQVLAKFKEGRTAWNAWFGLQPHSFFADLTGIDLEGADLEGFDLRGVKFDNACLRRAKLSGVMLSESSFLSSDVREAKFVNARLSSTLFDDAILEGADFSYAHLGSVYMRGARLESANFESAYLRKARFEAANLPGANLIEADLSNADLYRADLTEVKLGDTTFGNTVLRDCIGMDSCQHTGPSTIDFRTLGKSGDLPLAFLRGCGLPDSVIDYLPSLLTSAVEFYSSFISYSQADKEFASRINAELQNAGIRCWLDEKELLPGDDIYASIDRGIVLWDKLLLCCSENSLAAGSTWVDREITIALEKEERLTRERGRPVRTIIPLNLDGFLFTSRFQHGYRAEIRRRLAADFTGWETDDSKFQTQIRKLISSLRSDDYARPRPPESRL